MRLEFAANFDQVEPADLGACGEPYTVDLVCQLTNGIFVHGMLGAGIAGIDRPPNPWQDLSGLEIGGRVEWRWDRFSFALSDFWGYGDAPFTDPIHFYDRNVEAQVDDLIDLLGLFHVSFENRIQDLIRWERVLIRLPGFELSRGRLGKNALRNDFPLVVDIASQFVDARFGHVGDDRQTSSHVSV